VAGSLASILHAFGFGEFAQKRVPQDMRGDINFLLIGQMRVSLGGDAPDDRGRLAA
jgi:hypothetical protein